MKMAVNKEVANRLQQWAVHEMGYNQELEAEHLEKICGASMAPVWNFVTENVHSLQTIKKIEGNLKLQSSNDGAYQVKYKSSKFTSKKAELLARRRQLMQQLTEEDQAVKTLEKHVQKLENDVCRLGDDDTRARSKLKSFDERRALLSAYGTTVNENVALCEKYAQRVAAKKEQLVQHCKMKDATLFSRSKSTSSTDGVESACAHDIRESCQDASNFLEKMINGHYTRDKPLMAHDQDLLLQRIQKIQNNHSSNEVIDGLCSITQDSTLSLEELQNDINVPEDMRQLKYDHMPDGTFKDISTTDTTKQLKSITKERYHAHCKRKVTEKKSLSRAAQLQDEYLNLQNQIHRQLRDSHGSHVSLAKSLFHNELQCYVLQGVMESAKLKIHEMQMESKSESKRKQKMEKIHFQISNFENDVSSKQKMIDVLVKQNTNFEQRLKNHQQEIESDKRSIARNHQIKCESLITELSDCVSIEARMFTALNLALLRYVATDESGILTSNLDLSIYQGQPTSSHSQLWAQLKQILNIPAYVSADVFLLRVLEYMSKLSQVSRDESTTQTYQRQLVNINDVCDTVERRNNNDLSELVPVLQQQIQKSTDALTQCIHFKDSVQTWWMQQAQDAVPWLQTNNFTLRQWRDKFTVATTKIRQQAHK